MTDVYCPKIDGMKLSYREIEPFVKNPNPAARVIVVYGPDDGLMRERAKKMALTIVSDINDPFNAVTLTGDQIADDPARLNDEASAMSMMGGGRLIRITDASEKITPIVKDYLDNPNDQNLIIIEAGELGTKSNLRKLAEKASNAAAVPCYVEDERAVATVIRDTVNHAGYNIDRDAVVWLATNLTGDRQRVRSEVSKLITYMGPATGYEGINGQPVTERLGMITLVDAQNCCGIGGDQTLDDLVYNVACGRIDPAFKSLNTLLDEGIPVITILRAIQSHLRKLHLAKCRVEGGENVVQVMKTLSPPIFFKLQDDFKFQLGKWTPKKIENALNKLTELEINAKKTGFPAETVCAQAILAMSAR